MATLFELAARLQAAGAAEALLLIVAKATLILLIARVLLLAMPRASAGTKHMVATAALIAVAAMPLLTVIVPAWNIVVEQRAEPAPRSLPLTPVADPEADNTPAPAPADSPRVTTTGAAISLARATGVVPEEPLSAMERAMNVGRSTWKGLIVVGVGVGALLMLGQMLIGMFGVWFVAKSAEELQLDEALLELDRARDQLALGRDVRLLVSTRTKVPVIWGVFRPVLLLPADVALWPIERLRVVLLHELAHLKRFDGISLIATRMAVAVFWYHPLAWSLERAGRSECERACDDLVLASGTKPSDYADHLLAIARSMPTFDPFRSVTLAMSRKSQLEGRLLSILQPHVARRVLSGRGVAIACAIAIAVIAPISALRLTAEPSKDKGVKSADKTDSSITVLSDVDAIGDYVLTKLGKYDKRLDKLATDPKDGEDWYERGYDYYRNDRYAEAAEAFHRAAEAMYREETSLYNEACSYALLEDENRAIRALQQAIDSGWDNWDHLADDSDFDPIRSNPAFVRFVESASENAATRRVMSVMDRYEALRANPNPNPKPDVDVDPDPDIEIFAGKDDDWFEVGCDLLRLRKLDEAIQAFQNAMVKGQKSSSAMYNLACAYSLKKDATNGMAALQEAIRHGFSDDDKLENDPDIAFLRSQPGFDVFRQKAKDLALQGCCDEDDNEDWNDVLAHHRSMAQKHPNEGRAWFNLGFVALRAGDHPTSLAAFQKAIDLRHRVDVCSYNIACVHADQGNIDAAFEWLNKARSLGFELAGHMEGDEDLRALRRDPRWKELRDAARADRRANYEAKQKSK